MPSVQWSGLLNHSIHMHRIVPPWQIRCKTGKMISILGHFLFLKHGSGDFHSSSCCFFFPHYFIVCRHILHRYANEDVTLGSWFIGLDVEHIDERSLCCGTPPGRLFTELSLFPFFFLSAEIQCNNLGFYLFFRYLLIVKFHVWSLVVLWFHLNVS